MRKSKWIWASIVTIVTVLFMVSITGAEKETPQSKSLTLNQAVELAVKNNPQIQLADLGVDKANLDLEQAEFAADKMEDRVGNRRDQSSEMVIDIVPKQAESGKVIAETSQEYTKNNIKYNVESAYYGVLKAEKLQEVNEATYKRAQEQLKVSQARFKAGTAAKFDVITAESQLKSAEADLNSAKSSVKIAQMGLSKALDLDLDTPINATSKFEFKKTEPINLDQEILDYTEKDLNVVSARESYNIQKILFDYNEKYYTRNTFIYREAEFNLKDAQVKYDNAQNDLEFNIKNAYQNLITAEENYHVLTKSLEQAKEAQRLTLLRFQVGMATSYDVLSAETTLKQVELGLLNALYDYNLAKAKFSYGIFGGIGSSGM